MSSKPKFLSSECFICRCPSNRFMPIFADASKDDREPSRAIVIELLVKHFRFRRSDFSVEQAICKNCWDKLNEIDRFHSAVEKIRIDWKQQSAVAKKSAYEEAFLRFSYGHQENSEVQRESEKSCLTCRCQTVDCKAILSGLRAGSAEVLVQYLGFQLSDFRAGHVICRECCCRLSEYRALHQAVEQSRVRRLGESQVDEGVMETDTLKRLDELEYSELMGTDEFEAEPYVKQEDRSLEAPKGLEESEEFEEESHHENMTGTNDFEAEPYVKQELDSNSEPYVKEEPYIKQEHQSTEEPKRLEELRNSEMVKTEEFEEELYHEDMTGTDEFEAEPYVKQEMDYNSVGSLLQEQTFTCGICDAKFSKIVALAIHQKILHRNKKS